MLHTATDSVLILVDLQQRLLPAIAGGERMVREAVRLASIARLLSVPVIGTEQNPEALGPSLPELGSRTECNWQTAVARLGSAGVTCATVEMVAFEWLDTCRHPRFRDVLALIK